MRKFTPGRTIMVFGADGDRDATKRLEMARVAARGQRHPRDHRPPPAFRGSGVDPRHAARGRRSCAEHQPEILEVSPPEAAIRKAVSLAKEGDSILWAGPGHQDYRDIAGVRTPYSARDEARAALREAGWA